MHEAAPRRRATRTALEVNSHNGLGRDINVKHAFIASSASCSPHPWSVISSTNRRLENESTETNSTLFSGLARRCVRRGAPTKEHRVRRFKNGESESESPCASGDCGRTCRFLEVHCSLRTLPVALRRVFVSFAHVRAATASAGELAWKCLTQERPDSPDRNSHALFATQRQNARSGGGLQYAACGAYKKKISLLARRTRSSRAAHESTVPRSRLQHLQ